MDKIINKVAGLGIPGVMLMVAISMIASALTEFGFDALFKAVIKKLYQKGETKETIKRKIEKGPWSKKLKAKAISDLEKL